MSDQKFKENIQPMQSGTLAKVLQLKPVTYTMRKDEAYSSMNFPEGTQVGFIAQDVEQVFPELVTKGSAPGKVNPETGRIDETIDYKGLNYIGLTPILVEAIQEQQQIIDTVRAENADMKAQLASMNGASSARSCSGNVTTDANGYATVQLSAGFENANTGFRYQLTIVGTDFAQAIVYQQISNNSFVIRTDKPGIQVSWQVTGTAR